MTTSINIRNKKNLTENDIRALNFINASSLYRFRKYYRSGLRSHIFEVLLADQLEQEITGTIENGIRVFPRALPQKMFRIFRNQFSNLDEIFNEIKKYNLLLSILGPEFIAISEEFIVDYTDTENSRILLCGLQEYINGEILDPWKIFDDTYLDQLYSFFTKPDNTLKSFVSTARKNIDIFTKKIRELVTKHNYIPDLAGIGNLLVTPTGQLKLVDINNIVGVHFKDSIPLDDKGYPSCDVSIQVLFMLETKLLGKTVSPEDTLFQFFHTTDRMNRVKTLEKKFYTSL